MEESSPLQISKLQLHGVGQVASFRLLVPLKAELDDHLMLSPAWAVLLYSLIHLPCAFLHFSSMNTEKKSFWRTMQPKPK